MTGDRTAPAADWTVVVPTLGRESLSALLTSLARQPDRPDQVLVVDDRPVRAGAPDPEPLDVDAYPGAVVLVGGGRGPAHARNVGWQRAGTEWVVFVDDDVLLPGGWSTALHADLTDATADVGGVQAVVEVPLPTDRRPTDWERGTAGLADACWVTAEMAYRRSALQDVAGFDERFPRAFREDSDLALRVEQAGYRLVRGRRHVVHPVRPSDPWASLRQQRGNADDALMRRLHGRRWHTVAGCPPGRLPWHVATVATALGALAAALTGRPRPAAALAAGWLGLTGDFTWRRIAPGPRTGPEVRAMLGTSAAIPFAAVAHRLAGGWRHRTAGPWPGSSTAGPWPGSSTAGPWPGSDTAGPAVRAVLFDRDGTLVHDVPYNGDPDRVRPVEGAAAAVRRLRERGIAVGVVTNQSGIGRGQLTREQVDAVNARVEELLGPFDTWQVCEHVPDAGCACRKPQPGMVRAAAAELGVHPREVVVIGDIGADVRAAQAAGSTGILVPTPVTLAAEVAAAPRRASSLAEAVDQVLGVA